MKRHIIFFLVVVQLLMPSVGRAIEGLPGSSWGELYGESTSNGYANAILNGWIRQGVAWKKWQKGSATLQLNTYITARYKWDSEGFDWNNYLGPGAGVALEMYRQNGPVASWGVEHIYQINYRSADNAPYTASFKDWSHWWDISNRQYPGQTWGAIRWEIPNSGDSNVTFEGWFRQGVVWKQWTYNNSSCLLDPYVKVRFKVDSEGLDWNNYIAPGIGIAIDRENPKGPSLSWGIEYSWEKNLSSGSDAHKVELYMRWYAWWDLMQQKTGK